MTTRPMDPRLAARERVLHDRYARNALARGHAPACALVTTRRNWPTILGRPTCSCAKGPA